MSILSDNANDSLEVRDSDQFIVSYPRSGQTWFRSLLSAIREPKLDWVGEHVDNQIPDFRRANKKLRNSLENPRLFKSHEFYNSRYLNLLYIIRDVRAVAFSQWNWRCKMQDGSRWKYHGRFDIEFLKRFVNGEVFPGSWDEHIIGWTFNGVKYRKRLIISYENIFEYTKQYLHMACNFLNIEYKEEEIDNAIEVFPPGTPTNFLKTSIKPIKANPYYWKEVYTKKMLDFMNKKYSKLLEKFGYE